MNEVVLSKEAKMPVIGSVEQRCVELAIDAIKGDKSEAVGKMRAFLAEHGWELTLETVFYKSSERIEIPNVARFNRDPMKKGVSVIVPHVNGNPLPLNEEHVIDSIVHEFLFGRLYFYGRGIIQQKGSLHKNDYGEIKNRILAIDNAQYQYRSHWRTEQWDPNPKDRSNYSEKRWEKLIDGFLSSA